MPRCPVCDVDLERVEYEGFQIWSCPDCDGHSLSQFRLEGIKRSIAASPEQLGDEAKSYRGSTGERLRCPGCRARMRKELVKGRIVVEVDRCEFCEELWLDAGELAMLQLAYEAGEKGSEAAEFRRRVAELDACPERRERFEQNVANLPQSTGNVLGDALGVLFDEEYADD